MAVAKAELMAFLRLVAEAWSEAYEGKLASQ
jgi:hypothetical protein